LLSKRLLQWHKSVNNRELPWKAEKDAYKIWLSEILLQQTKAASVIPYYEKFILQYPTIADLANAKEDQVFLLWQGLGYYSRCRNLLASAKIVNQKWNGVFPKDYKDIIELPGIGPYTASAITSFAYNSAYAVLDGNVFRILARVFASDIPIDGKEGKLFFQQKANQLLPKSQSALYNQAIMDLGATICKPKSPLCHLCPWKNDCKAYLNKETALYPVKSKKIVIKNRYFHYLVFDNGTHLYFSKRKNKDIWQDLHEFALIESNNEQIELGGNILITDSPIQLFQQLTHQKIHGYFYTLQKTPDKKTIKKFELTKLAYQNIKNFAWPNMIVRFLNNQGFL
jgi:A/G-specific adenine glycosylase